MTVRSDDGIDADQVFLSAVQDGVRRRKRSAVILLVLAVTPLMAAAWFFTVGKADGARLKDVESEVERSSNTLAYVETKAREIPEIEEAVEGLRADRDEQFREIRSRLDEVPVEAARSVRETMGEVTRTVIALDERVQRRELEAQRSESAQEARFDGIRRELAVARRELETGVERFSTRTEAMASKLDAIRNERPPSEELLRDVSVLLGEFKELEVRVGALERRGAGGAQDPSIERRLKAFGDRLSRVETGLRNLAARPERGSRTKRASGTIDKVSTRVAPTASVPVTLTMRGEVEVGDLGTVTRDGKFIGVVCVTSAARGRVTAIVLRETLPPRFLPTQGDAVTFR